MTSNIPVASPAPAREPYDPRGMTALRVVVADDSVLLRDGLVLLREGLVRVVNEAGFTVVGSYGNAIGLLAQLETLDPDVAILDVRMPPTFRDEGVRAAIAARGLRPDLGILLRSQYIQVACATCSSAA